MHADIGESTNLQEQSPEVVEKLLTMLREDVSRGRSTDGPRMQNDIDEIELWKSGRSEESGKRKKEKKQLQKSLNAN